MGADCCALVQDAGGGMGSSLLKKGKSMAGDASQKLIDRIGETLDDKVEGIINEKLSGDSAFGKTIDSFVDKTFNVAMSTLVGDSDDDTPVVEVDPAEEELKRKKKEREERMKKAVERLRDIGMPQLLIGRMEQDGWLDERNWELLSKDQLLSMGFALGHIELFMEGVNKNKLAKQVASEKLKRWFIPINLINAMEARGYLDESKWPELSEEAFEWEAREKAHSEVQDAQKRKEFEKQSRVDQYMALLAKKETLLRENDELRGNEELRKQAKKEELRKQAKEEELRKQLTKEELHEQAKKDLESSKPLKPQVQYKPYWEPYKGIKLKQFGFDFKHIESFLAGLEREKEHGQPPEFVLYRWGIRRTVIESMRDARVLSENKWNNLNDDRLRSLGFTVGDMARFKFGLSQRAKLDRREVEPVEKGTLGEEELRAWGIPPSLVDRMKERGWVHTEFWDDLLEHDYELESLGFQNGHISTFKRKFREFKEKQDSNETHRKMKLLRKLEKPPKKQTSLLKRNIDVCNATDEPIQVRIIGERKYGTMESLSGSNSAASAKDSSRNASKSLAAKNRQTTDSTNESTKDTTKDRSVKVSGSGTAGPTPVNVGVDVGVTRKDTMSKTAKSTAHNENEQESAQASAEARRNKSDDASAQSSAAMSQHSWEKVTVGFTMVMPGQTIEFPVQISDPNAVVYMTLYAFSKTQPPVADNVQLDANYVKVEKVRIEGYGSQIKWQPGVKPPKAKGLGQDAESLAAKEGIFTMVGFCSYLDHQGIDSKKIDFLLAMLPEAQYETEKVKGENKGENKDEMEVLKKDLRKALLIYEQRTEQRTELKTKQEREREKGGGDDNKNEEEETKADNKNEEEKEAEDKNLLLTKCVREFLSASKSRVAFDVVTDEDEDDQKGQNAAEKAKPVKVKPVKRRHSKAAMNVKTLCVFLRNKGIADNKKIDFIEESLGGADAEHMLGGDTADFEAHVTNIIETYDELHVFKTNKRHVINTSNYLEKILEYQEIVEETKRFHVEHADHQVKYEKFVGHRDDDSDDEELHAVEKFFDVDSYSLLKTWGLQGFHERLVDEGWKNPLDWVHLDEYILKQNIGFRPGHIEIFNRKFDLWVKRYNDVRRTIHVKRKGKDGVLIVGKDTTTTLESNRFYEFTKVIVRENGTLTVQPWSPTKRDGGVLFIKSYQEIILEKNARISVDGKGQWGSRAPNKTGSGKGGGGSVFVSCCGAGGASYAAKGWRGYDMTKDPDFKHIYKPVGPAIPEDAADDGRLREWDGFKDKKMPEYVTLRKYDYYLTHRNSITQLTQKQAKGFDEDNPYEGEAGEQDWFSGDQSRHYKTLEDLVVSDKTFTNDQYATKEAIVEHAKTLGSGGGCSVEIFRSKWKWSTRPRRGGSGGGSVRIWCDKLIMYDSSQVSAKGEFDYYGDPLSGGGSGGAIFLTVASEIVPKNRDKENYNILLNARGGGQENMDRLYLEHMWTDAEKDALKYIRIFEKLILPYLEIQKVRQKAAKVKTRQDQYKDLKTYLDTYIASDDEDDLEDENDGDEENKVEPDKEEKEHVEENADKTETRAKMKKNINNVQQDKEHVDQQLANKVEVEIDDADVIDMFHFEQDTWNGLIKDQKDAMRNKYEMKRRPIAQQLAMILHEFRAFLELPQAERNEFHNGDKIPADVRYINEKDLWLWKWKKMPKFDPFEDDEKNEAAKKAKAKEYSRSFSGASNTKNSSVRKSALDDNFDGILDGSYEWVGIGGAGVIRVDYHSPFSIGWSKCEPDAYLGTDTQQADTQREQPDAVSPSADDVAVLMKAETFAIGNNVIIEEEEKNQLLAHQ